MGLGKHGYKYLNCGYKISPTTLFIRVLEGLRKDWILGFAYNPTWRFMELRNLTGS